VSTGQKVVVLTGSGRVEGYSSDGLSEFKGIPYAEPPVGKLRWLPPQNVKPWKGVREARQFGNIAPQSVGPTMVKKEFYRESYQEEMQSEDCLYLNIWTPGLDNVERPVMVWIHGGRFNQGSGSNPMYSGTALAKRTGVVVVTINYRLGPLGFLRLKEATMGKIPATGNEGLLDQIAALQWVHNNISSFGGDPDNITVFGESAGAMSVGCLLAMPLARGSFHKAILQSGSSTARALPQALVATEQFLDVLGLTSADPVALRALTVEQLLTAQQGLGTRAAGLKIRGAPLEPVVDEEILPEMPVEAAGRGTVARVPVMAGSTLEEWRIIDIRERRLAQLDEAGLVAYWQQYLPGRMVPGLIDAYRNEKMKRGEDASPPEIAIAIHTDLQFRIPALRLLEGQHRQNLPAYNYLFAWESPIAELGACHILDVGFVFDTTSEAFCGAGPARDRLVVNMQDAWTAFARTGDPSCQSLGKWPEYGDTRKTMVLGTVSRVEAAPFETERRAWDSIPDRFLG
jgi:para-nitrobenzyl esterase